MSHNNRGTGKYDDVPSTAGGGVGDEAMDPTMALMAVAAASHRRGGAGVNPLALAGGGGGGSGAGGYFSRHSGGAFPGGTQQQQQQLEQLEQLEQQAQYLMVQQQLEAQAQAQQVAAMQLAGQAAADNLLGGGGGGGSGVAGAVGKTTPSPKPQSLQQSSDNKTIGPKAPAQPSSSQLGSSSNSFPSNNANINSGNTMGPPSNMSGPGRGMNPGRGAGAAGGGGGGGGSPFMMGGRANSGRVTNASFRPNQIISNGPSNAGRFPPGRGGGGGRAVGGRGMVAGRGMSPTAGRGGMHPGRGGVMFGSPPPSFHSTNRNIMNHPGSAPGNAGNNKLASPMNTHHFQQQQHLQQQQQFHQLQQQQQHQQQRQQLEPVDPINGRSPTQTIKHIIFNNGRPEMPPPRWYDCCIPLGMEDDKYWLSELQCILRREFIEAFGTTQTDIVLPVHGRNKPIALGQVGLRCMHCKNLPSIDRTNHAIAYPSFISGIYNAVQQMFRQHFEYCERLPEDVRRRVETLKETTSNRGGRKQYWIDSAKRVGLVDTPWGVHFGHDPTGPLPPLSEVRSASANNAGHDSVVDDEDEFGIQQIGSTDTGSPSKGEGGAPSSYTGQSGADAQEPEPYPLVESEDRSLISDYLYLALEQMQPCNLMDADRVGCYKGRSLGFPGLACKHCVGQAGCGRYFPATEASLSQTTTSQTIVNHVRNCRRCPIEIREQLELMKRAKAGPDYKKSDKPKHGGRKVFFHRLWCRIQRIPLPKYEKPIDFEKDESVGSGKKRKINDSSDEEDESDPSLYDDISHHEQLDSDSDSEMDEQLKKKPKKSSASDELVSHGAVEELDGGNVVFKGRVRLSREDDPHWLSDAQCFIRQELTEVFTAGDDDIALGGASENGQVGVRCVYCAKNRSLEDRPSGHAYYPSSVSSIQQAVSDLQRRHFQLCHEIPDDIRETFKSLKGYGAKSEGDTSLYWIDSGGELGLCDSFGGQGVRFFRNPANNSPAEDLEWEKDNNKPTNSFVVRPEDRIECTDHLILLLKQFKPCRFKASDRRGGPNSRGRDRAIGFPGLSCAHCKTKRYFPVAAKNFSDTQNLMSTHIANCFSVPLPIKASLSYLQHRSILQKAELATTWKLSFFKRVWDRLHNEEWPTGDETAIVKIQAVEEELEQDQDQSSDEDIDSEDEDIEEESIDSVEVNDDDRRRHEVVVGAEPENDNALEVMHDLIKSAAIWLCERDAEIDRRTRAGRGRGMLQTSRQVGRGRGGRGGRGRGGK